LTISNFPQCPICGGSDWGLIHSGPVRNGTNGSALEAEVRRCKTCGVDRLEESACLAHSAYESGVYRRYLDQDHDTTKHFATHDELARFTTETIWPLSLRGKIVADVGCGGGALLDHLCGVAETLLAIEPALPWSASLGARGYQWFPSCAEATAAWGGKVDVILCTQVIEHVDDPCQFLAGIAELLAPNGVAVVSTPNRRDILMELIPNTFPAFFYRSQHRWYFDAKSLEFVSNRAGLAVNEIRHVHRYGLANTMHWLKEKCPYGRTPMIPLDNAIDRHWQAWLESTVRSDNLYLIACRPGTLDIND
jgi:2-polyprenyl-3-methyl-5-hydroxy-6-metoxy-1,4-benzoquinol methylase